MNFESKDIVPKLCPQNVRGLHEGPLAPSGSEEAPLSPPQVSVPHTLTSHLLGLQDIDTRQVPTQGLIPQQSHFSPPTLVPLESKCCLSPWKGHRAYSFGLWHTAKFPRSPGVIGGGGSPGARTAAGSPEQEPLH